MNRQGWVALAACTAVATIVPVGVSVGELGDQPSAAAPAGASKTAVLDVVRIFNECLEIKDLNEKMRRAREDFTLEVKRRQEAITAKQRELSAYKAGTPKYEDLRRELVRMNIEYRAWGEVTESDLERQRFDWTRVVYEKTITASERVSLAEGYDVVLQWSAFRPEEMPEQSVQGLRLAIHQRSVVYHDPRVDITGKVIQQMDDQYRAAGQPHSLAAKPAVRSTPTP